MNKIKDFYKNKYCDGNDNNSEWYDECKNNDINTTGIILYKCIDGKIEIKEDKCREIICQDRNIKYNLL